MNQKSASFNYWFLRGGVGWLIVIPYPKDNLILRSQADCETKNEWVKQGKCQRAGYENTMTQSRPEK